MEFSQIFTILLILLILYYVALVIMDIMSQNSPISTDDNQEENIDISKEVEEFVPETVSRENISAKQSKGPKVTPLKNKVFMVDGMAVNELVEAVTKISESGANDKIAGAICELRGGTV